MSCACPAAFYCRHTLILRMKYILPHIVRTLSWLYSLVPQTPNSHQLTSPWSLNPRHTLTHCCIQIIHVITGRKAAWLLSWVSTPVHNTSVGPQCSVRIIDIMKSKWTTFTFLESFSCHFPSLFINLCTLFQKKKKCFLNLPANVIIVLHLWKKNSVDVT